ncbi:MAG TPA: putative Ig domain-containing protein [Candidatus Acidoferrales bacterium]|nr:putative Ig domain-containing protein [Candidatus Acidoferrales bacterium]
MKSRTNAGACLSLLLAAGCLCAQNILPDTKLTAREEQIIAAARADAVPRFNGTSVIGIRPGTPFLQSLAVTGVRPVTFSTKRLPAGLTLDLQTGIITGVLKDKGIFVFAVSAQNAVGQAAAKIKIICGDTLALTPPMGWNSYDAFGDSVRESEVLSNALWLKEHLQPVGWDTVVVDFRWYDRLANGQPGQSPEGVMIDEYGRCLPAPTRFPSATNGAGFKPLADKIHSLGLKFGIHIMRGIPRKAVEANLPIADSQFTAAQAVLPEGNVNRTCVWNQDMFGVDAATGAGKAWYASIAKQYAAWGVDYIKCDDIANLQRGKIYDADEIEALSTALKNSGRSIVLSLSPGATPVSHGAHVAQFANLWRISPDFWDNWHSLNRNFELFARWTEYTGPGHWPDGDMIPFGHICQRNCDVHPDRWTRFTRDEQLTLMSLWALAPSPLMLGMNLPDNDEWTTAILTNPEVVAVDEDPLGKPAQRIVNPAMPAEIWLKPLTDGSRAVGFFNRTSQPVKIDLVWHDLHKSGIRSRPDVRDLWLRQDLGRQKNLMAELPAHGCMLLRVN